MIELSENHGEATHQLVKEFDDIGNTLTARVPHTEILTVEFEPSTPQHEWPYESQVDTITGTYFWDPEGKLARQDGTVQTGGMAIYLTIDRRKIRSMYRFAYGIDNTERRFYPADIQTSTIQTSPREKLAYLGYLSGRRGGLEAVQQYLHDMRESDMLKKEALIAVPS
jgi:hypothetical protein